MMRQPTVSIVIPTFNEEKNIRVCLENLKKQTYPKKKLETIIIDDNSKDKTLEIAAEYGAKIFKSGKKHIESSKSLGISRTKGELILFLDADVYLISPYWIEKTVKAFLNNSDLVGAQNLYWHYEKTHNIFNRYCELLGVNDPFVYMLGKRGILGPFEKKWINKKVVLKESEDYFLTKFDIYNLPTLGSQGYMGRKDLILKTKWKPYFFHLDSIFELVRENFNQFALMKMEVEHNYVSNFWEFHKKLYRNLVLFLKYRKFRKYDYGVGGFKFFITVILMVTLIFPLIQSIKGYLRKPDLAWFLHPVFCFTVPVMYTFIVLKNKIWN